MSYKYILFDLDGTLTDPAIGITNSVMHALEKFNIKVSGREELYKFIGPPLMNSFTEFYGFSEDEAHRAIEYYREYFSVYGMYENTVYDGIKELLAKLCEQGKKVVLASSKPEKFAVKILEHFDLKNYFYFVGAAAMDETRSTKEEVLEYVLRNIGCASPAECIMVGDRKFDVLGAEKFGIDAVGVLFGYGTEEEMRKANPKYLAKTVGELEKVLI